MTEGFVLADVLAVEGLGASAWREADAGWTVKLACEPAALSSYQVELAAAEDWLSRRVAPLEDDPDAWVAFLHAFTQSTEPFALLKAIQLGMNDVSRLGRRWARLALVLPPPRRKRQGNVRSGTSGMGSSQKNVRMIGGVNRTCPRAGRP